MFGTLLERVKNAFFDKDSGGIKFGSVIAAGAGALAGSMLLGPILAPLGAFGGIIGGIAGIAGGLMIKETVIPMLTGGRRQETPQPSGPPERNTDQRGTGRVQEPEIQTPDGLPPRPGGRGGRE